MDFLTFHLSALNTSFWVATEIRTHPILTLHSDRRVGKGGHWQSLDVLQIAWRGADRRGQQGELCDDVTEGRADSAHQAILQLPHVQWPTLPDAELNQGCWTWGKTVINPLAFTPAWSAHLSLSLSLSLFLFLSLSLSRVSLLLLLLLLPVCRFESTCRALCLNLSCLLELF